MVLSLGPSVEGHGLLRGLLAGWRALSCSRLGALAFSPGLGLLGPNGAVFGSEMGVAEEIKGFSGGSH